MQKHKPVISLIAAMDRQRVIGIENRLPWRLPADMRHFKKMTLGKPVLMGRKTFESIGKPLPGRLNVVITRDVNFTAEGCVIAHSIDDALAACREYPEIMVMGGASFYAEMLPRAEKMYLTFIVSEDFHGDAFFPKWNATEWHETASEHHEADAENRYAYQFVTLERV